MNYKTCTNCGKTLPATTEYFHKNGNCQYGLNARCKECRSQIRRERYASNPELREKVRARAKDWRVNNPEKAKERSRLYYEEHKQEALERVSKWREKNPDLYQAQLERRKQRYADNIEMERQRNRQYYQEHKEDIKEYVAKWCKDNPEMRGAQSRNYRARKYNAGGSHTADDIQERIEEQGYMCFYCSHPLEDDYHVDHYYPLAKGGSNDAENIVIACPSCNMAKSDKDPDEFMEQIGRTFVTIN